jgi:hypothetical protein
MESSRIYTGAHIGAVRYLKPAKSKQKAVECKKQSGKIQEKNQFFYVFNFIQK